MKRRDFVRSSLAFSAAWSAFAAETGSGTPIPFLDTKPFTPEKPLLIWEELTSFVTPNDRFFHVGHYGRPAVDASSWKLEIGGLVKSPRQLTLADIKARPKKEHMVTLECSGNGPAGGLIGNARWTGTPLAPLLKEAGVEPEAIEAVFFAVDQNTEKIRGGDYPQHFARSLDLKDAMEPEVLLAYEMNGEPLNQNHGAPLRLIVPKWYGVAWVKWLNRIELQDRHFLSRFMGRDYVTIRGEKQGDQVIWRETSVGRMNLKSVVARAVRKSDDLVQVTGAAWSGSVPVKGVEIKVDDGPWTPVKFTEGMKNPNTWKFWSYDWKNPTPGEHTLTSRATDERGRVQPTAEDPFIALKKTYWEANQQAPRKLKI